MFEGSRLGFAGSSFSGEFGLADAMQKPMRAKPDPSWRDKLAALDLVPDLAENIGSARWFRGLGTLSFLLIGTFALLPDFGPVYGAQPSIATQGEFEESRAQMIMPLAYGADSGRRMGATDAVVALAGNPERPRIELSAMLGRGDSFARVLQRAGVGSAEAEQVANMVAGVTSLTDIEAGTPIAIVLGARTSRNAPRPLESVDFRARFDLNLAIKRAGGALQLKREPIAVDDTPLRIRGTIGDSPYRSMRSAGVPISAAQAWLKVLSDNGSLRGLSPSDEFDVIVEYRRAESGEVKVGNLIYAGVDRNGKSRVQMLKWGDGDSAQWFEASGVGETKGALGRPVNGHITSQFGMRRHPILGYVRMHSGMDWGAAYGSPIFAVADGVISYAGHKGGYGNFVSINHGGGMGTGYGHMSRITARAGSPVRRGQIIGYVGSSGLSTGPHLHYEVYRNGKAINPASFTFTRSAALTGPALAQFRAKLAKIKSVAPGAALTQMKANTTKKSEPVREIDRLTQNIGGAKRG